MILCEKRQPTSWFLLSGNLRSVRYRQTKFFVETLKWRPINANKTFKMIYLARNPSRVVPLSQNILVQSVLALRRFIITRSDTVLSGGRTDHWAGCQERCAQIVSYYPAVPKTIPCGLRIPNFHSCTGYIENQKWKTHTQNYRRRFS